MRKVLATALAVMTVLMLAGDMSADQSGQAGQPEELAVTMAGEYGLTKTQIASFDVELSSRLIRFGKVAQGRGRYVEAKRYFWQALLVDPLSTLAWQCYDQAVVFCLANKVEQSPGLVGLPGLSDAPAPEKAVKKPAVEEGC